MYGRYEDEEDKKPHPIFDHPYFAPLADPVKNTIGITLAPLREFVEAARDAARDMRENEDYNWPRAFFGRIDDLSGTGFMVAAGAGLGILVGGISTGIAAGGVVASSFGTVAGLAGGVVAGFGGAAVGAIVGPFIAAGVVGVVAFAAGLGIGVVPGFFTGCIKAAKHFIKNMDRESAPEEEQAPAKPKGPGLLSVSLGAVKKWFVKGHAMAPNAPASEISGPEEPAHPSHTPDGALEYLRHLDRDGMRKVYDSLRTSFEPVASAVRAAEPAQPALAAGGAFENLRKLGA